jgi:Na+/H+ antiporter NhaD/arsenite permease-like protein
MAINYLVVHLKETKRVILYLQNIIQLQPRHGFWMTSIASLVVSPFLTNDGVCLLFVEPILNAFEGLMEHTDDEHLPSAPSELSLGFGEGENNGLAISTAASKPASKLAREDAVYFMLTLACSSNIGSALTYTGNPQVGETSHPSPMDIACYN